MLSPCSALHLKILLLMPDLKNLHLVELDAVISSFSGKKVPFSMSIAKNAKIVKSYIDAYNEDRLAIINKFAMTTSDGSYLGVERDGVRVQEPNNLNDIMFTDRDALMVELVALDNARIGVCLSVIDINKEYFDSSALKMMTISEFIDANIEPNLVSSMDSLGLITI